MSATLRPGRSKVTTSFVIHPDLHNEFRKRHPKRGDQSYYIEQLIKKYLHGEVYVPPKPAY